MSPTNRDIDVRPPHSGRLIRENNSALNVADWLAGHSTPFNTQRIAGRTSLFELKSIYGVSALRDVTTTEGSATVGHNGPSFTLDTTANGPDRALLESGEKGRYTPGILAEPSAYFQSGSTLTGNMVQRWPYLDANNGLFFERDSQGMAIVVRSGGSQHTKVRQADWNVDTLDGSGGTENPSGLNLDVSEGHIYLVPFVWYGSGPASWDVIVGGERVTVHEFTRTDGNPLIENPNLPVAIELDNDGTATAQSALVSGRQFAVIGDYEPNRRTSAQTVTGVSVGTTGFTHLMSFRRKANVSSGAFFEAVSVKLAGMDIVTDQDLQLLVVSNATLTTPSWGSLTHFNDAETALEVDTSASVSGGEGVWEQILAGGGGNKTQFASVDTVNFDMVRRQPLTVLASAIDSTATVDCTTRLREAW